MDLRIEHLSKTYDNGTRALNDVSLTIPPGMFGLLGPNGAGKSTLMRILATLQEADEGSVTLGDVSSGLGRGIDVLSEKDAVRRTLGYLPQEFGLYPKVTAEDLLDHFAVLKGITNKSERKQIVDALLEQTNLQGARKKQLGSYSGGMRQRFGIAVALLGKPGLIIVDEPTAGLDPAERVRFLNLLAELGENAIVILSTHIVDDVSDLCSRMAIIDRGQIRQTGEPEAAIAELHGKDLGARCGTRGVERLSAHARRHLDEACRRKDARPRAGGPIAGAWLRGISALARGCLLRSAQARRHCARRRHFDCFERMTQFLAIVRWELRLYLRRISTWVYFGIFFAIAFLLMSIAAGAFSEAALAIGGGGKVLANAPFSLSSLIPIISVLGVSITAALSGNALFKDYETRADPLFYTTPVSKAAFLGGRFTGTLIVNAILTTGIALGAIAATFSPWVKADKLAAFHTMSYVQPYLELVLPNLILTAAIFFALVSLTRQMLPNYVGGATLLIGYLLAGSLLSDMDDKRMAALIDPFGMRAQAMITQYWSIAEKNGRLVPFTGVLLENRLLWLGVAAAIFAIAFVRFKFAHRLGDVKRAADAPSPGGAPIEPAIVEIPAPGEAEPELVPLRLSALPATVQHFDRAARWTQFKSVFARSFWRIVRNRYFGVIVGAGLLYLLVTARAVGKLFGTTTWPVTYQMESLLSGQFGIFIIVIIAFYSGELIWAERDVKLNQIYDATPVTNGVVFFAKFAALASVIAALLVITMFAGIGMQAARGYYHFEIPVYLESLFGFRFIDLLLVAVLAMVIHVLVNHKYVGHFLVIVLYIGNGLVGTFANDNLYEYGSDAGYSYSDMNRWGAFVGPFVWWKLYWTAFAAAAPACSPTSIGCAAKKRSSAFAAGSRAGASAVRNRLSRAGQGSCSSAPVHLCFIIRIS